MNDTSHDRWLTKDEIGPYSGIVYGKSGDKVTLICESNVTMSLVDKNGTRFHVRTENLSDKPLTIEIETVEVIPEVKESIVPPPVTMKPKVEAKKTVPKNPIQQELF